MSSLTTDELKSTVIEFLEPVSNKQSVLTRAGASSVTYMPNGFRRASIGGAGLVKEGSKKPLSHIALESVDVKTCKLVQLFTVTNEFERTEEGRKVIGNLVSQAIESLIHSLDIAILAGTDPRDGQAWADFSATNLKNNATSSVAAAGKEDASLLQLVTSTDLDSSSILLARPMFNLLSGAVTKTEGLQKYSNLSTTDTFPLFNSTAILGKVVNEDGFTASSAIKNNVLAYAGDFSRITRTVSQVEVRSTQEATIGGENTFENNTTGYLIELHFKFSVEKPGSFAVLKSA